MGGGCYNHDYFLLVASASAMKELDLLPAPKVHKHGLLEFSGLTDKVLPIDDYAKDGGKELFTKMHCVLITNP